MSDEVESVLATILLRNPHEGFYHFQIRTSDWTKTTWYAGLVYAFEYEGGFLMNVGLAKYSNLVFSKNGDFSGLFEYVAGLLHCLGTA